VIFVNERHLKRLLNEYLSYYHEDRMHLALDKQTPAGRAPTQNGGVVAGSSLRPNLTACITATTGPLELWL
jgi:hypothetical protein